MICGQALQAGMLGGLEGIPGWVWIASAGLAVGAAMWGGEK